MCILNKDLKFDMDIIEKMNQFLFMKMGSKILQYIMESNNIDEKLEPELVEQIDITKFTLIEPSNFPELVPCIYD